MSPAERVIEKFGGHQIVANILHVTVTQIYRFTYPKSKGGTGGLIPSKHQQALLEHGARVGIDFAPADFFEVPVPPTEGKAA